MPRGGQSGRARPHASSCCKSLPCHNAYMVLGLVPPPMRHHPTTSSLPACNYLSTGKCQKPGMAGLAPMDIKTVSRAVYPARRIPRSRPPDVLLQAILGSCRRWKVCESDSHAGDDCLENHRLAHYSLDGGGYKRRGLSALVLYDVAEQI